jgi:hypothetical protein
VLAEAAAFGSHVHQRPPWLRPEDYEHWLDGLRRAGWLGEARTKPSAMSDADPKDH